MIRFLILFSFLINLFFVSLRVFSGALILSTYSHLAKINFPLNLGYSRLQRGYQCYSSDTHRYFVSADITFFEQSSIFSTPPPSSPEVLSLPLIFPFWLYHLSPQLLHLDRYRFILIARVPTPGLQMTHLLWRPPPRRRSCLLPLILPSLFGKVLVPLVIPILFIIFCLIIVYLRHILLLFPTCLLFLFLTLSMRPSLIRTGNVQWLKK